MHAELLIGEKLHRVVIYHFEIPMTCAFQKCKLENQGLPSDGDSVLQFLGHVIKSYPILFILVPNLTHGTQVVCIKYQPSQSTQL